MGLFSSIKKAVSKAVKSVSSAVSKAVSKPSSSSKSSSSGGSSSSGSSSSSKSSSSGGSSSSSKSSSSGGSSSSSSSKPSVAQAIIQQISKPVVPLLSTITKAITPAPKVITLRVVKPIKPTVVKPLAPYVPPVKTLVAGTKDQPIVMPKVDTTLMSPVQKIKNLYENLDIKAKGLLPGGITPEESRLSTGKEKVITMEKVFGGQPKEEVTYFGDKQISNKLITTPTLGGKGTNIVQLVKPEDIKPDYSATLTQKVIENIPGLGTAGLSKDKQIYVTKAEDLKTISNLVSSKSTTAGKELRVFLADKEAEYKKDIGSYNLNAAMGNVEETNKLATKINLGTQFGTLGQMYQKGVDKELESGKLTKSQYAVKSGAYSFATNLGVTAVETLPLVLTGGIVAKVASKVPALTGALVKGEKVLSKTVPFIATGASVGAGASEYKKSGNIYSAIGAGAGTGLGFVVPFSKTGEKIVKVGSKQVKNLAGAFEKIGDSGALSTDRLFSGKGIIRGKKGSTQVTTQSKGSDYEEVRDASGNLIGYKKKISRDQATEVFKGLTRSEQVNILEGGFKGKVYLDDISLADDLKKARSFLKSSGLTDIQIDDRLASLTARIKGLGANAELKIRELTQARLTAAEKVNVPIVKSKGGMKPITLKPNNLLVAGAKSEGGLKIKSLTSDVKVKTKKLTTGLSFDEPKIKPTSDGLGKVSGKVFSGLFVSGALVDKTESKTKTKVLTMPMVNSRSLSDLRSEQDYGQDQTPKSISGQLPIPQPPKPNEPNPLFGGGGSSRPRPPEPIKPRPQPPIKPFGFGLPDRKKKGFTDKPYDAEVYVDATKGRKAKWQKVADNVPLVTALSKGGRFVDESASNRFRVTPQKGKMSKVVDTAWNQLQGKFREYTQKGGVKVGLRPRNYIENRAFRIDSSGERKAIPQQSRVSIGRNFGRL